MTPQLVQGLLHLLGEAMKKSDWLRVPAVTEVPMAPSLQVASALVDVDKPKYLN